MMSSTVVDARSVTDCINVLHAENTIMKVEMAKLKEMNERLVENASRRKREKRMLEEVYAIVCGGDSRARKTTKLNEKEYLSPENRRVDSDDWKTKDYGVPSALGGFTPNFGLLNASKFIPGETDEVQVKDPEPLAVAAQSPPTPTSPKAVVAKPQPVAAAAKPQPVAAAAKPQPAAVVAKPAAKPPIVSAVLTDGSTLVLPLRKKPAEAAAPVPTAAPWVKKLPEPKPAPPVVEEVVEEEPEEEVYEEEAADEVQDEEVEECEADNQEYEEEEAVVEEEEEEEYEEMVHKGVTFYVNTKNRIDSPIYAKLEDESIGDIAGHFVKGVVTLNAPPVKKRSVVKVNK